MQNTQAKDEKMLDFLAAMNYDCKMSDALCILRLLRCSLLIAHFFRFYNGV